LIDTGFGRIDAALGFVYGALRVIRCLISCLD
jgi:uncharacterized membrane protein required for colicin V production